MGVCTVSACRRRAQTGRHGAYGAVAVHKSGGVHGGSQVCTVSVARVDESNAVIQVALVSRYTS
jgi:hypothetical protein